MKSEFIKQWRIDQKNFETSWQDFLKKETYLIFEDKEKFLKEIKELTKFPWHYWLKLKLYFENRKIKKGLKEQIINYNSWFINSRLKECASFFDGKDDGLKYPLNDEQRRAIIKDDKHNLVIAGAGSGKTSVLTSRIAYLIRRKDSIKKEKILALAFTKVAAREMEERLKKDYNIEIDIFTFHALGWKILQENTGKRPKLLFDGDEYKQYKLIENIFKDLLKDVGYQNIFIDFLSYHIEKEVERETFESKELYFKYMRNKLYTSLNNIEVKSISERNIANFFFRNNINFNYEGLEDWVDNDDEEREYHPDFYLPDYDIFIEHWGLNEKWEVPEWFSISSEEYKEIRDWKLAQFKKHQKTLIETWEFERQKGVLLANLKNKITETNPEVKFEPLSYNELLEKTHDFKRKRDEIAGLIASFIKIAKSNFLKIENIKERIKLKKYSAKQKIFGQLALEVYNYYQKYLKDEDKIDFNDMINEAVDHVKNNPGKYLNIYDHVLIDEFQDISYQRLEMIKDFVNEHSNTKLFCVGDDWQSIYQFTGSDVRFFTNFSEYFPHPEVTNLTQNYRSSRVIVEMSNDLISKNKTRIKKEIRSNNDHGQSPLVFELAKDFSYSFRHQIPQVFNLIKILIAEGIKPDKILVLSRFNNILKELEILCGANDIPTERKSGGVRFYSVHSSKGSESEHVIVIDVTSGPYGFPCEILDSSILNLAKRYKTQSHFEEERRLFYVAITRSKRFLYLFTIENNISMFLNDIQPYLKKVFVDTIVMWNDIMSDLLSNYLVKKELETPAICPDCGRRLKERQGKYGKFLGCSGYPICHYTFDLNENDKNLKCPWCNNRLVVRDGKYGKFLSCISYPKCDFAFDLKLNSGRGKKKVYCLKCGKSMVVRKGKYGNFLGCTGYPKCKYTYNF
ncbi:MAG: UvrD-helicase domain-containing protein [Promethearchaeota archaeon]